MVKKVWHDAGRLKGLDETITYKQIFLLLFYVHQCTLWRHPIETPYPHQSLFFLQSFCMLFPTCFWKSPDYSPVTIELYIRSFRSCTFSHCFWWLRQHYLVNIWLRRISAIHIDVCNNRVSHWCDRWIWGNNVIVVSMFICVHGKYFILRFCVWLNFLLCINPSTFSRSFSRLYE